MIEFKTYHPDEVFKDILDGGYSNKKKEYCGHQVKVSSIRLATFKKNRTCVACGIVGNRIILEHDKLFGDNSTPHFNLYANWSFTFGKEYAVNMTADHIVPVSKGGSNGVTNMQTMCSICNTIKSNYTLTPVQVGILRGLYNYAEYLYRFELLPSSVPRGYCHKAKLMLNSNPYKVVNGALEIIEKYNLECDKHIQDVTRDAINRLRKLKEFKELSLT
jgi:5-methylcytosine-specific restriction endonuclease McrA